MPSNRKTYKEENTASFTLFCSCWFVLRQGCCVKRYMNASVLLISFISFFRNSSNHQLFRSTQKMHFIATSSKMKSRLSVHPRKAQRPPPIMFSLSLLGNNTKLGVVSQHVTIEFFCHWMIKFLMTSCTRESMRLTSFTKLLHQVKVWPCIPR